MFVWLRQRPDSDVPLLVAAVSQSSDVADFDSPLPIPPNAWAGEDIDYFASWFGAGGPSQNVSFDKSSTTGLVGIVSADALQRFLVGQVGLARPGGPDKQIIAIFVTAQGLVHESQPYLLMSESRLDDPATWVHVGDLTKSIATTLKNNDVNPNAQAVLFLDAARAGTRWDWGTFYNGFPEACAKSVSATSDRVAVISSCRSGERSWWDPRRGRSLFAQAIVDALAGESMEFASEKIDRGMITVAEIASYLEARVSAQAEAIWNAPQHPELLTATTSDWVVVRRPQESERPSSEDFVYDFDELVERLKTVRDRWQQHEQLRQQGLVTPAKAPLAFNPVGWSALTTRLARLDELAMAGAGYRDEFEDLDAQCKTVLEELQRGPPALQAQPSLPELRLSDYLYGSMAPTASEQVLAETWAKTPDPTKFQEPIEAAVATRVLWDWLNANGFTAAQLESAAALLKAKNIPVDPREAPAPWLETYLIRLLSAPDLIGHVAGDHASTIAAAHRASRDAMLPHDMRAAFWLRGPVTRRDQERLALTDEILSGVGRSSAVGELKSLTTRHFPALADAGAKISAAYQLRDQMLLRVPSLTQTLLNDLGAFHAQERSTQVPTRDLVQRAMDASIRLANELELPLDATEVGTDRFDQINSVREIAQHSLDELEDRLNERVRNASQVTAADQRGLRQSFALLTGSGVTDPAQRGQLHERLIAGFRQRIAGDAALDSNAVDDQSRQAELLDALSIAGRHPWIYWLELFSNQPGREVRLATTSSPTATKDVLTASELASEGTELRASMIQLGAGVVLSDSDVNEVLQQPAALTQQRASLASVRRRVAEQDLGLRSRSFLVNFVPPALAAAVPARFELDFKLFTLDLVGRTLNEFWCGARDEDRPFFSHAADQLLGLSNAGGSPITLPPILDGQNLRSAIDEAKVAVDDGATLAPSPLKAGGGGEIYELVKNTEIEFDLACPAVLPQGGVSIWADENASVLPLSTSRDGQLVTKIRVPENLADDARRFEVRSFFRGLRRLGDYRFERRDDPHEVVFQLPSYDAPAVLVSRDDPDPLPVVLVLDYSGSMTAGARLNQARTAVENFLLKLKNTGTLSVGLVLFGHDYAWLQKGGNLVVTDNGLFRVVNAQGKQVERLRLDDQGSNNNPNFWVEQRALIEPLNDQHFERLVDALRSADAAGVTPTYQAILKAYEMLDAHWRDGRNQQGHIFVLTDGEPFLAGQNVRQGNREIVNQANELRNVLDQFKNQAVQRFQGQSNITLTIVDYAQGGGGQLRDVFNGADFKQAADGNGLQRILTESFPKPEVAWQRNNESSSAVVGFDEITTVQPWPPQGMDSEPGRPLQPALPYEIEVTAGSADRRGTMTLQSKVDVAGGELFRLHWGQGQLLHRSYLTDKHSSMLSLEGVDADRYGVHVLPPDRHNNRDLTLRLVVQNKDPSLFTPRPQDVWIELIPIGSNVPAAVYSFGLPEFENAKPVPVLRCRVRDWPKGADRVRIKVWFHFAGPAARRVNLPLDAAGRGRPGERIELTGIEGVAFRIAVDRAEDGITRLTITEQYDTGPTPVSRLRVVPSPLPTSARIVADGTVPVVTRTFEFDQVDFEQIRVDVTEKSWIEEQSANNRQANDTIIIER